MAKVLITGGTGLVGMALSKVLYDKGVGVHHLSRASNGHETYPTFTWDISKGEIDKAALDGVDRIIHLAGAPIANEKWSDERKKLILDSRVKSAELLLNACKSEGIQLKQFVSASAIGWYPLELSEVVHNEESPAGKGYLAEVCQSWEEAADQFDEISDRVTKLRIGLILTKNVGALSQIVRPINFYLGAGLGTGKQYMSWIHLNDVVRMFDHVLTKRLSGVYNAVGPEPTNNQEFMQTVADVVDKPILLPNIPEFVIRILFGPAADMVLRGVPLSSAKICATGFQFEYPTLNSSLFDIYWSKHG
jgi:hypothetical protein